MDSVKVISPVELTPLVRQDKILVVDSRTFCEYNTSHVANAVNVWSSKIRKKRLQQCTASAMDFLRQACQVSEKKMNKTKVVVYDQNSKYPREIPEDSFLHVLLSKLSTNFDEVSLLEGGFLEYQSQFPDVCEDTSPICPTLTSLSQPCLPASKCGFSRILPFLYLGSQNDANSQDLLQKVCISYELNVSTSCPQPGFVVDTHFLRIPVNDNFNEKLIPHFAEAFRFIDKAKEAGERVLVHCLAGISRSPTIAIAYVMKHLRLHYDEAYRYVKQRRPTISPNINFVGQLLEFDRIMMGKSSMYYDHTEILRASMPSMHKSTSSPSFEHEKYRQPKISLPMLTSQADYISIKTDSKSYVSNRLPSSPTLQEEDMGPFVINNIEKDEEKEKSVFRFEHFYEDSYTETKNYLESKSMEPLDQPSTEIPIKFSISIPIDLSCIQGTDSVKALEKVSECKETPNVNVHYENVNPLIVRETKVLVSPDESPSFEKPELAKPVVIRTQFDLPKKSVKKSNSIQEKAAEKLLGCEKTLPRCYSSSETHLNTRRILEANKENETENSTRKSFSTDEVHRGWPLSPHGHFSGLIPSCNELNRCDSWSTSGLGSEISDWESLHDENHPADDIAGPYDAVFSEVFIGDVDSVISDSSKRSQVSDVKDQSGTKSELGKFKGTRPKQLRPLSHSSSAKNNSTTKEEIQKSIKRPASLPGVSNSYSLNLKHKSASLDLGVGLEESPGWQNDKGQEMFNFDPKAISKQLDKEHEPVEDYDFTTWLNAEDSTERQFDSQETHVLRDSKIRDCISHQNRKHSGFYTNWQRPQTKDEYFDESRNLFSKSAKLFTSFKRKLQINDKTSDRKFPSVAHNLRMNEKIIPIEIDNQNPMEVPIQSGNLTEVDSGNRILTELPIKIRNNTEVDRKRIPISNEVDNDSGNKIPIEVDIQTERKIPIDIEDNCNTFTEISEVRGRLRYFNDKFKKIMELNKLRDISFLNRGSLSTEHEKETFDHCKLAGIRIAQELVQPVEDMLESEMNDIKERTNALRARYGLSSTTVQSDSLSSHRRDPIRWSMRKSKDGRAKSEPPLSEEGLYRVRSCPGLPHKVPKDSLKSKIPPIHENRHSCGALDSLPPFLSTKSIYELKRYLLGNSPSSSVRMLQVS